MKKFCAPWSIVFMLFLIILTGCGKGEEASTEASEKKEKEKTEETRTVEHLLGKAEVPAEPKK